MKVLVCGGRDFGNISKDHNGKRIEDGKPEQYRFIMSYLDEKFIPYDRQTEDPETWLPPAGLVIIAGAAKGVDSVAIDWAVVNWCMYEEYWADWNKHGKAAGHIRNKQMIDEGKPDLVIAFPGGRGTANMVSQARAAGIPVEEVEYNEQQ